MKKRINRLVASFKDSRGSATVEFVVLALPLFIPIFLFLGQFSTLSGNEIAIQTLARETLRGYIESKNDESGEAVVNEIISKGGRSLGLSREEIESIRYEIKCSKNPCHLPSGRVRITLLMEPQANHGREIQASAQQYFSPWIG